MRKQNGPREPGPLARHDFADVSTLIWSRRGGLLFRPTNSLTEEAAAVGASFVKTRRHIRPPARGRRRHRAKSNKSSTLDRTRVHSSARGSVAPADDRLSKAPGCEVPVFAASLGHHHEQAPALIYLFLAGPKSGCHVPASFRLGAAAITFALSFFGFLASRLPRCCPLAMMSISCCGSSSSSSSDCRTRPRGVQMRTSM